MTHQPHNPLVDKVVDGWIAAHRIMDDWTSASIPYRAECVAEYFRRQPESCSCTHPAVTPCTKPKTIIKEKIVVKEVPVIKEKVITKQVPVVKEKVVVKEIPVVKEKVITKEVPVIREKVIVKEIPVQKVVVKEVPVVKHVPVVNERVIVNEKVVVNNIPVVQEKVVVKEVPVIKEVVDHLDEQKLQALNDLKGQIQQLGTATMTVKADHPLPIVYA